MDPRRTAVTANGVDFALLEAGPDDGPLALCLHGFPDTAWSWRHLMADLADAGYRAVAPFMRGYAPTAVPADGRYQTGALVADAVALHEALGGDGQAVLVGHDWGAIAAYGAAVHRPDLWRAVVAAAVPPMPAMAAGFLDYGQLRRSWYMFFFQSPLADVVVPVDDLTFIDRLWADWSPGYDGAADAERVKEALRSPANLTAALGYYRAQFDPARHDPALQAEQQATQGVPPQPTLYLHGENDGCIGAGLAAAAGDLLSPGSASAVLPSSGHFLQLERPEEFGRRVVAFLER